MGKFLCMLLVALMCLGLFSCDDTKDDHEDTSNTSDESITEDINPDISNNDTGESKSENNSTPDISKNEENSDHGEKNENSESNEESSSNESDKSKYNPKKTSITITSYQDGLFFGYELKSKTYVALDTKGDMVFTLSGEHIFPEIKNNKKEATYFFGDYAYLKDNTIINKKGEVVFDLAKTDYDGIYCYKSLDIGYLICYTNVNTFEETAVHFYAVNIETGKSFEIDNSKFILDHNKQVTNWFYFGNGYFAYNPSVSERFIFDIKNNSTCQMYAGYKSNGEKDYYITSVVYPTYPSNEPFLDIGQTTFYKNRSYEYNKLDCESGFYGSIRTDNYEFVSDPPTYIYDYAVAKNKDGVCTIVNMSADTYLELTTDYRDLMLYTRSKDGAFSAKVINSGGGAFYTVIEANGERRFEPIAIKGIVCSNEKYVVASIESGTVVYDWHGKVIKSFDSEVKCVLGEHGIIYSTNLTNHVYYNFATGEEIIIKEIPYITHSGSRDFIYANGCFNNNNIIINENGQVIYMQIDPAEIK